MTGSMVKRAMSDRLTMEDSLSLSYQPVNLIVFIYELGVRYGRHAVTAVDVAEEIRN